MLTKKVVVTGLGALTPIGNNVEEYWQALSSGIGGAGPITKFDASNHKTQFACELKNYKVEEYFNRKEARKLDPFIQYALIACEESIRDAGLNNNSKVDKKKVGVVWGSGIGGFYTMENTIFKFLDNNMMPHTINPFFIPKILPDMPSGYISIKYGFQGPNFATVSACASSLHALISGLQCILLNNADIMIIGGSEAPIIQMGIGGFNALRALSQRNESPETASRPFDKTRDGFVIGEGAGALILESYEHAKTREAKIYAEVVGFGMSSDAYHATLPHTQGVTLAMQQALQSAEIMPQDIDYINVHGTSTQIGDLNEIRSIQEAFGAHIYNLNISSTKSMTGHLLGAAGAIEAIASILAIKYQLVPPTINFTTQDEAFNPAINFTFNKAQKRFIHYVQKNSFGFGGHNASVIFKKWENV